MELKTEDEWQSDDASDDRKLHTGDGWQSGDASDDRRLHTGDGSQSGDASDDRRLYTGDGWQSGDATDDRRLHTGDEWQSGDGSDDRRLHTGDEWQSGDASDDRRLHTGDGSQSGDASDDTRLHTADEWQTGDATDDRRLHTEDGWQSGDTTDDRRLHTGDGLQSGDALDEKRLHTGDGWLSGDATDDRRLHTGDGLQSGDATDERRLHTGDGWQSGDATDERRLHSGDGWQSGDATDERRLHTGDGWQSGDGNCKHLTTSDVIENGCETLGKSSSTYTHNDSFQNIENALGEAAQHELDLLVAKSEYIGIMVDESFDVAIYKKLILYLKVIINGTSKVIFGENVEVVDGKANTITTAIIKYMTDHNIPFTKLVGFASDGASTMVGRFNGVHTQLKNINPWIINVHCAAHKLALAAFHGAKAMPYLMDLQKSICSVFYFFKYSPTTFCRYQKLRELKNILGKKVKKFKKASNVRWLSISEAVNALHGSWGVLVMTLENEIETNKTAENRGLLMQINNFKFLASIAMLHDVLGIVAKLAKVFQKDNIDIDMLNGMIETSKQTLESYIDNPGPVLSETLDFVDHADGHFHGVKVIGINDSQKRDFDSLKRRYIESVISKINERFHPDQMDLLQSFNRVLNPKCAPNNRNDLVNYGVENLNHLLEHYGTQRNVNGTVQPPLVDSDRTRNDFLQFKFLINSNKHKCLRDFLELVITDYPDEFPDFCTLSSIFIAVPLTSVPYEREISNQNRIKSKARNRLGIKRAETKMKISCVSKTVEGAKRKAVENAIESFLTAAKRRKNNYK